MPPTDLKYMTSHEWVRLEGAKATFGITDFAVAEVKDIVFVDLPASGATVTAGEPFGAIETVKAAFDLYAPVSGTVQAVNQVLASAPETVSQDPYGKGWMIEVAATSGDKAAEEARSLLDAAAYEEHCRNQPKH